MGVRGLTTFIKNQEDKYLKRHKLHNCFVLVDGNSIASNLFIWSNVECAFGGDYDKFAKYVKEFFKNLKKCEVRPLVVFDGGYEQRKLRTVYSRMKEKFRSARDAKPLSGSLSFPLFTRIILREVLSELNIPFCQSDFEADDELAALARQFQCPVLSFDSDFYIYDVLYIPLPSMNMQPVALKKEDDNAVKYYIDCKIYCVDTFIDSFGGLDKNMLPLLAALLGNDYIRRSTFKAFYANLKIPKGKTNPLQRRIKSVIEWLQKETFDSAVKKIMGRMKKSSRRRVMEQIKKTVNGYVQCSSILSNYLEVVDISSSAEKTLEISDPKGLKVIEQFSKDIDDDTDVFEDYSNRSDEEGSSETEKSCEEDLSENELDVKLDFVEENENFTSTDIPVWLLDYARKGKIQSCVIDILTLKQYFLLPQVEDYSLTPSHQISLNLLSAIVGLLLGKNDNLVKYWTRNGVHLDWYTVDPIYESKSLVFPPCSEILTVCESKRKSALMEIADVSIDVHLFPNEWQLFVIGILFWLRNMKEPSVTESHLHVMVMCLVAIYTIDSKIGVHRKKSEFNKKYKKYLSKLEELKNKRKTLSKEASTVKNHNGDNDVKIALNEVTHEDCVFMFEAILPYHHLNMQIKAKPKQFCLANVHAFAQFQSCLFHLIVFNSILGFPFQESVVSRMYSGTFAYNMFVNLSKRNNIHAYVDTFFQSAPTLLRLYRTVIVLLKAGIPDIQLLKKTSKKSIKRRKKQNLNEPNQTFTLETTNEDKDEEQFFDENNVFSSLSINV